MNKDDIIHMAREAGFAESDIYQDVFLSDLSDMVKFAALIAAAERERFAAECIDLVAMYGGPVDLEAAIRERGQA